MYRVKTEVEFEQEFGRNWQDTVSKGWDIDGMEYLFGYDLTKEQYNHAMNGNLIIDGWYISADMVVSDGKEDETILVQSNAPTSHIELAFEGKTVYATYGKLSASATAELRSVAIALALENLGYMLCNYRQPIITYKEGNYLDEYRQGKQSETPVAEPVAIPEPQPQAQPQAKPQSGFDFEAILERLKTKH